MADSTTDEQSGNADTLSKGIAFYEGNEDCARQIVGLSKLHQIATDMTWELGGISVNISISKAPYDFKEAELRECCKFLEVARGVTAATKEYVYLARLLDLYRTNIAEIRELRRSPIFEAAASKALNDVAQDFESKEQFARNVLEFDVLSDYVIKIREVEEFIRRHTGRKIYPYRYTVKTPAVSSDACFVASKVGIGSDPPKSHNTGVSTDCAYEWLQTTSSGTAPDVNALSPSVTEVTDTRPNAATTEAEELTPSQASNAIELTPKSQHREPEEPTTSPGKPEVKDTVSSLSPATAFGEPTILPEPSTAFDETTIPPEPATAYETAIPSDATAFYETTIPPEPATADETTILPEPSTAFDETTIPPEPATAFDETALPPVATGQQVTAGGNEEIQSKIGGMGRYLSREAVRQSGRMHLSSDVMMRIGVTQTIVALVILAAVV
ncbi:hypothetical protein BBBOND_0203180 [Babesia bigemina]|uniref:Uncharacterized protein n=1 Tax=Babesia bigemina TaxID=5866 RepID=A0A061D318_BABBI|nr:hypothetical protein BBBOND_0203180 [Babesia bigemina]CDR95161.1 hypothetical protein BBBOND_0203180 [Babesia bigemina]|eukprot:XP_012767347.1 hypothetical protein BBBOND_0203180 [Babesia bigemina]